MAAHATGTYAYQALSLTTVDKARGVNSPTGASRVFVYVSTAAAVVYAQFGAGITDGTTDISGSGGLIPTETWVELEVEPDEAEGASSFASTLYLQTDTNPTAIRYRFTRGAE